MKKLMLLAAIAVGYVLGAKAGRGRYEQIRSTFQTVKDDPRVQQAASSVASTAKEQAPVVADKVSGKVSDTVTGLAASAKETVAGGSSKDLTEELHPDSTARQENPYPQGDLP